MSQEENNEYFEQVKKALGGYSEEELVSRIQTCQDVADKLQDDPVWKAVLSDAHLWVNILDSQWQDIYDEKKLNGLRVLKQAYKHIASLPERYKTDLKAAQDLLSGYQNIETEVQKDYDNETNLEE